MKHLKLFESFKKSLTLSRVKDIINYNTFMKALRWITSKKGVIMSDLTDDDFEYMGKQELIEEFKKIRVDNRYIFFLFRKEEYLKYVVVVNDINKDNLFNYDFEYSLVFDFDKITKNLDTFRSTRKLEKPIYHNINKSSIDGVIKQDNLNRYLDKLTSNFSKDNIESLRKLFKNLSTNKTLPILNITHDLLDTIFTSKLDENEFDLNDYIRHIYKVKLNNFYSSFSKYGQDTNSLLLLLSEYDETEMPIVEKDLKQIDDIMLSINTKLNNWIKSIDYSSDKFLTEIYQKWSFVEKTNGLNYELNQFLTNPSSYNFRNCVYSKNSILSNLKRLDKVIDSIL